MVAASRARHAHPGVVVKTYTTAQIRNVALLGHGGAGKTTLAEALLARAGVVSRPGSVDDGTSLLDTEPEAHKRGISLSLAIAPFEWTCPSGQVHKINLIDTPGYADFTGEVDAALAVADLAVMVVSAVEGVEVQTELLWRRAAEAGIPRLIFVNKENKERADFDRVLGELQQAFGTGVIAIEMPIDRDGAIAGIADVLSEHAMEYTPDGTHRDVAMPDALVDGEHRLHDVLVEEIVSGDDEQLERYLAGDVPTVAELERTLAHEVLGLQAFPVLVGSATTGVGLDRLADLVCELGPSPADRPVTVVAGDTSVAVAADGERPPLAYVFKTIADPFVGQLSVFKVLSGEVAADDRLVNSRSGTEERLHGLFVLRGKQQEPTPAVIAGDIGAVAKLTATATGDTLAPKGSPVRVLPPPSDPPGYGVAIVPRSQADDDKLVTALARLQGEDPSVVVERVDETHQTVLRGTGDTHIAVTLERLSRKFGVNVDTDDVKVPYRETVTGSAAADGKVKKQTGGHGQFAVASLRVSPLERGGGFRFTDSVVGGAIPRNFIPAVQRGIEDTMRRGGVMGFPVVDVAVECYDGKYHAVDSSEMAFRAAAAHGFTEAMAAAGVAVLEPVSRLVVTVPTAHQGDVMSDITTRRGRVVHSDTDDTGAQRIEALVPTAETLRYAIDLRSLTGGRGRFTIAHSHYDVLPTHLLERATPPTA